MTSQSGHKPRSRWLSFSLKLLFVFILYMGIRAWFQRDLVSGVAPEFNTNDISGMSVELASYNEQAVLVHFWAVWCAVCAAERDVIQHIDKSWPVVSIAMQSGDTEIVKEFMQSKKFAWRTINDEQGHIAERYGVKAVPTSFIVKEGEIIFAQRGYITRLGLWARLMAARLFY